MHEVNNYMSDRKGALIAITTLTLTVIPKHSYNSINYKGTF